MTVSADMSILRGPIIEPKYNLSFEARASKVGAHKKQYHVLNAAEKRIEIAIEIKKCRLNLWMELGGCVLEGA